VDLVVYDDDDRRYVPAGVAVLLVLLAAVLAGAIGALATQPSDALRQDDQAAPGSSNGSEQWSPPSEDEPAVPGPAAAQPTPPSASQPSGQPTTGEDQSNCLEETLQRADAVRARAERLAAVLAEHTAVMDDVLAERLTKPGAIDRTLPVLTRAATERRRYAEESAAYQRQREACES